MDTQVHLRKSQFWQDYLTLNVLILEPFHICFSFCKRVENRTETPRLCVETGCLFSSEVVVPRFQSLVKELGFSLCQIAPEHSHFALLFYGNLCSEQGGVQMVQVLRIAESAVSAGFVISSTWSRNSEIAVQALVDSPFLCLLPIAKSASK